MTTIILTENGIADAGQELKLAELKQRLSEPDARLMLFLHGGLVDEQHGLAAAHRLSGAGDDSWKLGPEWTQLYVVWRTGAFETLQTNWRDLVHDDRLYQTLLRKLLGYVGKRLGIPLPDGARSSVSAVFDLDEEEIQRRITGQGDRRDPFAAVDTHLGPAAEPQARATVTGTASDAALAMGFEQELATDPRFQAAVAELDAVVNAGLPGRAALADADMVSGTRAYGRLSVEVKREIESAAQPAAGNARGVVSVGVFILKHAGLIAYRVFERFRTHRDHGFHATVVEEICRELYGDLIGAKVWGMMVQDAADHFAPGGFGSALLDLLGDVPAPARFVVAGHSAGSIWASRMLLALRQREQAARLRLILLAPAVRHDLFAQALEAAADRIEFCRMFTMTDTLEARDAVLGHDYGYIYPASLLYCVSGLFEERGSKAYADAPLVGMLRFADACWLNAAEAGHAKAIATYFTRPENGIVTSPTPGVCVADCHGCFSREPLTLKSAAALF